MRFLFYSHDGFGLGHTCRNLAIAKAVTELAPRASVLLATGSDDVTRLGVPDNIEVLKLPSLRKLANECYASRYLNVPAEDVRLLRSRLLSSAVESFRPDVMLVDKHPFGAGGELKQALGAIRSLGARAILGLRDILDEPATVSMEWRPHQLPEVILDFYHSVLVYGQERIFNTAAAYDFPASLRKRTKYAGYVTTAAVFENQPTFPPRESQERPVVLATVGGGEDGAELLADFVEACGNMPWRPIVVTGPMMPLAQRSHLEVMAHAYGVTLHTFVPGLSSWFGSCATIVCMAGYNTIAQTLAAGAPLVCVPRTHPRREQWLRAQAFARRGLLRVLSREELHPERLRQEIAVSISLPRAELRKQIRDEVDFDGAEVAAHHLLAVARRAKSRNLISARNEVSL